MTTPSVTQEEKRRLLLEAAVRVFATKGFHTCRVGDVAEEAGVAHGLLYHYFDSKQAVLETIFRETWAELLGAVSEIEISGEPAREQLRRVAATVLRTWRRDPDLVRVLVREVARGPQLQREVEEIGQAFAALERIVEGGRQRGELRTDIDARLASVIFYGALEEILTGWVLGQIPDSDDDVALAERTVVAVLCDGLVATDIPARPGR